ncbi:MAG: RcnB family protein [Hydrogenophaga sp.]|jgi:Ni/Co efflux regulator RcnB|uniref:RcnB family protein n=1 Tax=Hydrogenophaga sp. TaxID=1904254 RepID=UPI002ABA91D7|nr:RcnB family protein [Hydrogenophaga sp.]MDZ4282176.1 RcnB family protein [Hydrogenophaga sp.]
MKPRNIVVHAIAAATLSISSLSFAQGNPHGGRFEAPTLQRVDDRRDDRRDHRADRRDDRRDFRQERREDRRDFRHDRRADRHDYRHGPQVRYYQARGPQFQRGRYIPQEYRGRQYVVVNHHQHRLYAPPRGQQWVQVGSDYVLVAIATGLIVNLILNN